MRHINLVEYARHSGEALIPTQIDQLQRLAPSISIAPTAGMPGCFDLRPRSFVGGLRLEDLAVIIRPKVDVHRVLFLLAYAMDSIRWQTFDFDWAEKLSLVEAIVPGFVAQVRRVLQGGLLQGYTSREDALSALRGRIRFDEQVRRRYGIFPPLEVRYDEYSVDILENRLIRAAAHRLARIPMRADRWRGTLRALDAALDGVSRVEFLASKVPEVVYTRLNEPWRPAVELARWILRHTSHDVGHGGWTSSAFLVDMNRVFEDFVVVALREALGVSERTFPQNCAGRALYLDSARRIRLEPDLSWWVGGDCVFVGDVKYKRLETADFRHPDVYQLLAYLTAADLPWGLLVYAAGEAEPAVHTIQYVGKRISVVALDLAADPPAVLAQVAELARLILRERQANRAKAA